MGARISATNATVYEDACVRGSESSHHHRRPLLGVWGSGLQTLPRRSNTVAAGPDPFGVRPSLAPSSLTSLGLCPFSPTLVKANRRGSGPIRPSRARLVTSKQSSSGSEPCCLERPPEPPGIWPTSRGRLPHREILEPPDTSKLLTPATNAMPFHASARPGRRNHGRRTSTRCFTCCAAARQAGWLKVFSTRGPSRWSRPWQTGDFVFRTSSWEPWIAPSTDSEPGAPPIVQLRAIILDFR